MPNKILISLVLVTLLVTFIHETLSPKHTPLGFGQEWVRTDFSKKSIELSEISESGLNTSSFKTINSPIFIATKFAKFLDDNEPVISVRIKGKNRAYPLRYLLFHHVINDVIDSTPIAITYSPLSNSAIIYKRRVGDKLLQLSSTGKFRQGNSLLYDLDTYTWWQQFNGEAVIGPMLGTIMEMVPARIESVANYKRRAPNSEILITKKHPTNNYGHTPYTEYDSMRWPMFFTKTYTDPTPAMDYIVMSHNQAWLLKDVQAQGKIIHNDLKLVWTSGQFSVLDSSKISDAKDIGNVTVQQKNQKGKYIDTPYVVTFAFAFKTFYPEGITHY